MQDPDTSEPGGKLGTRRFCEIPIRRTAAYAGMTF